MLVNFVLAKGGLKPSDASFVGADMGCVDLTEAIIVNTDLTDASFVCEPV